MENLVEPPWWYTPLSSQRIWKHIIPAKCHGPGGWHLAHCLCTCSASSEGHVGRISEGRRGRCASGAWETSVWSNMFAATYEHQAVRIWCTTYILTSHSSHIHTFVWTILIDSGSNDFMWDSHRYVGPTNFYVDNLCFAISQPSQPQHHLSPRIRLALRGLSTMDWAMWEAVQHIGRHTISFYFKL